MAKDTTELIETFYRAFAGNAELLPSVVTADWEDIPSMPGQERGPAGITPLIDSMKSSVVGLKIDIKAIVDGRDESGNGLVGVRAALSGVHTGEFFGVAGTGKPFSMALHEFHEVRDGRIARTWHQEDLVSFFRQVDAWPAGVGAPPESG